MKRAILLASICLSASVAVAMRPTHAGFYDGNKIIELCLTSRAIVNGYVAGAFDAAETAQPSIASLYVAGIDFNKPANAPIDQEFEKIAPKLGHYCIPQGAVLSQFADIFCRYLGAHPEQRQESADFLLTRSLNEAWPCPKIKPRR